MIGGLQKVTLLDFPGKVSCTVFLTGCNLRCPYCHNTDLVLTKDNGKYISEKEFFEFLLSRKGKLDGVCITGGEPTLYPNLTNLIRRIREMGFLVKLDSNGTVPEILKLLLREKLLDYVAIDIKSTPTRYAETCGADVIEQVKKSAALLKNSNIDYEFRTTVCHPFHSPDGMQEIGRWLRGAKRYFIQPFVDSGNLLGSGISAMAKPELKTLLKAVKPYIPAAELRGV